MRKNQYYFAWGGMFLACAALGFLGEPDGLLGAVCFLAGLGFFVPPALVLRSGDRSDGKLILCLSFVSLLATTVLLVANIASVRLGETAGTVLHAVLVVVSTPMFCCRFWALSLFLWASLLVCAVKKILKKQ